MTVNNNESKKATYVFLGGEGLEAGPHTPRGLDDGPAQGVAVAAAVTVQLHKHVARAHGRTFVAKWGIYQRKNGNKIQM